MLLLRGSGRRGERKLSAKKENAAAGTGELENEINRLAYALYG